MVVSSGSSTIEGPGTQSSQIPSETSRGQDAVPASGSVSIIVPTFNEAENVERVIERCREAMTGMDYEVLIVDDDSPDGTWRIAERASAGVDNVRVLRRENERDLGTAVVYGFERATKEFCAVIDADMQHPPELIPELTNHATEYVDIVIGSRYRKGGYVENWPLIRHVVSRGAIGLTKLWIKEARGLDDPLSGFFVLRRSVVDVESLDPKGYKILLEILVRCEYSHVVEVPYRFHERRHGRSKLSAGSCREFLAHLADLRRVV